MLELLLLFAKNHINIYISRLAQEHLHLQKDNLSPLSLAIP
jgi:hypothetical protein